MSRTLKISFSTISLIGMVVLGLLAHIAFNQGVEDIAANTLVALSVFIGIVFIFSLYKIKQSKPKAWIRTINKLLLSATGLLTGLSLLVIAGSPSAEGGNAAVSLLFLGLAVWGLTGCLLLGKALSLEKEHFKEKSLKETAKLLDASIKQESTKFVNEHFIIAGIISVSAIAALLYLAYFA